MATINKPLLGRAKRHPSGRGSEGSDLEHNLGVEYRCKVGAYLRKLREGAGMTQEEMGKLLDVGNTHISAMEHGRSALPPEHYETIVSQFGLDRRLFGEFMLRYTNPWLCALLMGVEGDRSLKRDIKLTPSRVGGRGH